ncbi:MAG: GNAT family N-acetyltransferase [Ignavibacteria bacterium]
MKILKATLEDLETVSVLFDLYRQFYEQTPDIESAKIFIRERIENNESVIFLALENDNMNNKGMGFVQLYPVFTSVGMKRMWILNDLFVHEDHRKKGVAEALTWLLKNLLKKQMQKVLFSKLTARITALKNFMIRPDLKKMMSIFIIILKFKS